MSKTNHRVIYALFNDDDIVLNSVKKVREKGYHIQEIYSPFPIHGLDKAMGLPRTKLAICSFLYGITGLSLAILMMSYMMIHDWPQDIGGKPNKSFFYNMPSFVPIMFEITVFCAAHLMVFTYFCRCELYPGKKKANPDPRTTDDKFLMEVPLEGDEEELKTLLKNTGAIEITVKDEKE